MSPRILIVDDDPTLLDIVGLALENEGFETERAADGTTALELALGDGIDVVILDLMLPDLSGTEVCRRIRAQSRVPILMLTAKDAEVDRVLGLELGADDYVTKPFSLAELVSRVRAILRRRAFDRADEARAVRSVGGLRLDLSRHQLLVDGAPVQLTASEFKLLAMLAEQPEKVFSRRQIMERLWESDHVGDEHACHFHISNLRRKIESDPAHPRRLLTVRGFGYKLVPA